MNEETILNTLIGEPLSSVEFVMDYVQLHFNGLSLMAFTMPEVHTKKGSYNHFQLEYKNELCNLITRCVREVYDNPGNKIELVFNNDVRLSVSLKRDEKSNSNSEAAKFDNFLTNEFFVWIKA